MGQVADCKTLAFQVGKMILSALLHRLKHQQHSAAPAYHGRRVKRESCSPEASDLMDELRMADCLGLEAETNGKPTQGPHQHLEWKEPGTCGSSFATVFCWPGAVPYPRGWCYHLCLDPMLGLSAVYLNLKLPGPRGEASTLTKTRFLDY